MDYKEKQKVSEQEKAYLPLEITIESQDYSPGDSEWQEECHSFYEQIKSSIGEGSLEPRKLEVVEDGHRGGILEIFSTLTAGIASIGGLTAIIGVAKLWLEYRKGTEIELKFPDGTGIKLSSASEKDIDKLLTIYEKKLAQSQPE
jgi:hypothetical protein